MKKKDKLVRDRVRAPAPESLESEIALFVRRHLRMGWWSLLIFLTVGLALEGMHGFKISYYLDVSNKTRRLMWTLSHAHATLLALINIAFAATVQLQSGWRRETRSLTSRMLLGATVILPLGFFLGGVVFYSGDPGMGILLVPLGALLLFAAVLLTARGARSVGGKAAASSPRKSAGKAKR